jgi:hypothetical protein
MTKEDSPFCLPMARFPKLARGIVSNLIISATGVPDRSCFNFCQNLGRLMIEPESNLRQIEETYFE